MLASRLFPLSLSSSSSSFFVDRMGPNKLSTFVPAANKSEVPPESELAVLLLVQDSR